MVFGLYPSSGIVRNTNFRTLDLFPSSDEEVADTYSVESIRKSWSHSLNNLCQYNYSSTYKPEIEVC
jgi:hypothetical protein